MPRHFGNGNRSIGFNLAAMLSVTLCLAGINSAQTSEVAQYHSRNWQTDSGLPNNAVQAIVQTRDGYLWIGTQYGLARFDGVRFTIFNRNNVPEMKNPNVLGLREAFDGTLWVATGSGGVLKLKNGKFTHFGKAEGLASDYTLGSLAETPDGAIWIGTLGGLSRLQNGKFQTYTHTNGLATEVVRDLWVGPNGTMWLATGAGVDYMRANGVIEHIPVTATVKSMGVRAICCDTNGVLWYGAGNELHRWENGSEKVFLQGNGLPYNIIKKIYFDSTGKLWVGSYGGLSWFEDGDFVTQSGTDQLPFDLVNSLFEDREGNIWIGSRDGLTQFRAKQFTSYTAREGLPNHNVMSVLEDRQGTMWIGTWGGGLSLLHSGISRPYTNEVPFPLPTLVLALHEGHNGCIWVGTDYGGDLFQVNGDTLRRFSGGDGLPGRAIRVVHEDRLTNVWVGTSGGLYRKTPKARKFKQFGADQGLTSKVVVREMLEDHQGAMWVATEEGLWRFSGTKGTKFTKRDGLSDNATISLHEDAAGDLWIGTAGSGLNWYHNGHFVSFTMDQGMFSDIVCDILEDDRGWFWMSCPRGVFRVSRRDLEAVAAGTQHRVVSIAYGKSDGMVSELCNGVAKSGAWKSRDGRLWFATSKGACVIDPATQTREDRSPPELILEQVLADKQAFPASETLPVTDRIRVPPGHGDLEFFYAALTFRAPERCRFRYKLEGTDHEWVEAGARRVATYHNLPPGKYTFRVMARNANGVWNEAGATATVLIEPHFWQTWWFRSALMLGVAALVVGAHQLRLAHLREIERFRLRVAADLHDDVGSNVSTISLLSRRLHKLESLPQEASEDLGAISRLARQTTNSLREIVWLINPEYDTIQDLALRMQEASKAILAGIDCEFQQTAPDSARKLSLPFRQNLFLIYKETLTNVARHSQASRVRIDFVQFDHTLQLQVRDNGIGFNPEQKHSGHGLANLQSRATKLHGQLKVDSQPGSGTTISIKAKYSI